MCVLCKYAPSIARHPPRGRQTILRTLSTHNASDSSSKDERPSYALRESRKKPHTRRQNSAIPNARNHDDGRSRVSSKPVKETPEIDDIPPDLRDALNRQLNLFSLTDELRTAILPRTTGHRHRTPKIVAQSRRQSDAITTTALSTAARQLLSSQPPAPDPTRLADLTLHHALLTQLPLAASPASLQRLTITALSDPLLTTALASPSIAGPLSSALLRLHRAHPADTRLPALLTALLTRFRARNIPPPTPLLYAGLHMAAAAPRPTLSALRRHLVALRARRAALPPRLFGEVVRAVAGRAVAAEAEEAGCEGGTRGEWVRAMVGVEGVEGAGGEPWHLGLWMEGRRADWGYLGVWVRALGRVGDAEGVWREWEGWVGRGGKRGAGGGVPEGERGTVAAETEAEAEAEVEVRAAEVGATEAEPGPEMEHPRPLHAPAVFIHALLRAGSPALAWRVFAQSGVPFTSLPRGLQNRLVQHPDLAPAWTREMEEALLALWTWRLRRIECALGVCWVSDGVGGGFHRTVEGDEGFLRELMGKGGRVGEGGELVEGEVEGLEGAGLEG